MQIFLARGNQTCGPYSQQDVIALLNDGSISLSDRALIEGESQWAPVSSLPFLPKQQQPAPPFKNQTAQRTCKLSVVAFIISLMSLLALGLTSILGIIVSHIALRKIRLNRLRGYGIAVAGLTIGYLGLAFCIGWMTFFLPPAIRNSLNSTERVTLENDLAAIQVDLEVAAMNNSTSGSQAIGYPFDAKIQTKTEFVARFISDEGRRQIHSAIHPLGFKTTSPVSNDTELYSWGAIAQIEPARLNGILITNTSINDAPNTIVAFRECSPSSPVGGFILKSGEVFTYVLGKDDLAKFNSIGFFPNRQPTVLPD